MGNEPARHRSRARPRHARGDPPWVGNLRMAFLILLPLALAWALLPASAKPGAGGQPGRDGAAAAAPAADAARRAALVDAERPRRRPSAVPATTTSTAAPTTTRAPSTTTRPAPRATAAPSTAAGPAGSQSTAGTLTSDLFERLNAERRARGLPALSWDRDLARVAADWSAQMARTDNFSHRDLGAAGGLPGMAKFSALGENIAWVEGYPSMGSQLHVGWMRSAGHRANMLQRGFDSVGIGVVCSGGRAWATQNFGRLDGSNAPSMSSGTPPEEPIVATRDDGVRC
ncbi:MAG TPA: CAP domain-containing protein [Actinomycetes bacterium]|nr:CAP domain-containing protein [Actinomycetes bacterium]